MIVFDLDDTLYPEADFVESGYQAVANVFSKRLAVPADELLKCMYSGKNPFDNIANMYFHPDMDLHTRNLAINEMVKIYRYHLPHINLSSDVCKVLFTLRQNFNLGIITDGRSITQHNKINALGLNRLVDPKAIVISEEIGADKQTEIPFLTMMRIYNHETNFVYVADNPQKDFFHPNHLGWLTIMLKNQSGRNIHSQLLENLDINYHPQIIINDFKQLISEISLHISDISNINPTDTK